MVTQLQNRASSSTSFSKDLRDSIACIGKFSERTRSEAALREFVGVSRSECKLTLARYLFTPEEVVDRIVKEIQTTDGVKDLDVLQPQFMDAETAHALQRLPDFEAAILRLLCTGQRLTGSVRKRARESTPSSSIHSRQSSS